MGQPAEKISPEQAAQIRRALGIDAPPPPRETTSHGDIMTAVQVGLARVETRLDTIDDRLDTGAVERAQLQAQVQKIAEAAAFRAGQATSAATTAVAGVARSATRSKAAEFFRDVLSDWRVYAALIGVATTVVAQVLNMGAEAERAATATEAIGDGL